MKMQKLETDPESEQSKEFYRKLEETERANTKKRPAQVIIKTMKRGGKMGATTKIEVGPDGKPVSLEEAMFRKKYVDYQSVEWPVYDPIKFERKDVKSTKMINFSSYLHPA